VRGAYAQTSPTFLFDVDAHTYTDAVTGHRYPSITGLLKMAGWVDDRWYTEASRVRGTAVHKMAADYDLGALTPAGCVSPYRGWLLAHDAAMRVIKPTLIDVEIPRVHPTLGFAGRPDRTAICYRLKSVLELKSGAKEKAHPIQTALQAILVAPDLKLPAHLIARLCLYLKANGKYALDVHDQRADFDEAHRIIRRYCAS
jgi:hypothetical protein